jgi:hypothetical protein
VFTLRERTPCLISATGSATCDSVTVRKAKRAKATY